MALLLHKKSESFFKVNLKNMCVFLKDGPLLVAFQRRARKTSTAVWRRLIKG